MEHQHIHRVTWRFLSKKHFLNDWQKLPSSFTKPEISMIILFNGYFVHKSSISVYQENRKFLKWKILMIFESKYCKISHIILLCVRLRERKNKVSRIYSTINIIEKQLHTPWWGQEPGIIGPIVLFLDSWGHKIYTWRKLYNCIYNRVRTPKSNSQFLEKILIANEW